MQTVSLEEAEGHLGEIISHLAPGEEIVVTRDDKPVAIVRATGTPRKVPQLGTMKGSVPYIAPDFDDIPEGFEEYLP